MPSLYRFGRPYGPHNFTARKRDALKLGRELSREAPGSVIYVCEIETARLPLLDLLSAALNGKGWDVGRPVTVAAFLDGIEQRLEEPEAPPVRIRERPAPQVRERKRLAPREIGTADYRP